MTRAETYNQSLNILHLTASVGPKSYGIGQVVLNLAKEQNRLGHKVYIWSLDDSENIDWASSISGLNKEIISGFPVTGSKRLGFSLSMDKAAYRLDHNIDILHQHSLWTCVSHVSNILRRKHDVSTVVTPHGPLEKWAIKQSPLKKKIAITR